MRDWGPSKIANVFLGLAARVIFTGLCAWGLALYLQNEWMMYR